MGVVSKNETGDRRTDVREALKRFRLAVRQAKLKPMYK